MTGVLVGKADWTVGAAQPADIELINSTLHTSRCPLQMNPVRESEVPWKTPAVIVHEIRRCGLSGIVDFEICSMGSGLHWLGHP